MPKYLILNHFSSFGSFQRIASLLLNFAIISNEMNMIAMPTTHRAKKAKPIVDTKNMPVASIVTPIRKANIPKSRRIVLSLRLGIKAVDITLSNLRFTQGSVGERTFPIVLEELRAPALETLT